MSLQSTHTTTVNSLQRELEAIRESHRLTKIQLRELEMGNDDLERHERFVWLLSFRCPEIHLVLVEPSFLLWKTLKGSILEP